MTIKQFRQHKTLPHEWSKLLYENPVVHIVMQVMEKNHPARMPVKGDMNDDVSETSASIQLGETRGYSKYASTLELLADPLLPPMDLGEPTYQKEEVTTNG